MSILIKGMEMPTSCYGCPFFKQVDYWNKNDEADILSKCKRTGEFTWESVNGYLPNCPLVPVPKHGRLIDADALKAMWDDERASMLEKGIEYLDYHVDTLFSDFKHDVDKMPNIIPAEECEG